MTSDRSFTPPPEWDDDRLESDRRRAVADFIAERMTEGSTKYQSAFTQSIIPVETLFTATNDLLDFASGSALAMEPSLIRAARYLSGPPVSADDLDTLAETSIAKRKRIDADLARKAAEVIAVALDPERFPWLFATPPRRPTDIEREAAIRWTAGLMTIQQVQTGRRGESATRQEAAVLQLLTNEGFQAVTRRPIGAVGDLASGEFCHESPVLGAKCDIPVCLRDGRYLFIECKVSNSSVNSVKRLIREVGGNAPQWRLNFGEYAMTAAVLAGVLKLTHLREAQTRYGITLFWEHDLGTLASFLRTAT